MTKTTLEGESLGMRAFINTGPVRCSKCGSTRASRPVNSSDIEIECLDCGHFKKTREAERRESEARRREWDERMRDAAVKAEKAGPTF